MEIRIPDIFVVRMCPDCRTQHAPIRDCSESDFAETSKSMIEKIMNFEPYEGEAWDGMEEWLEPETYDDELLGME